MSGKFDSSLYEILQKLLTVKEDGVIYSDGIWLEKAIELLNNSNNKGCYYMHKLHSYFNHSTLVF